MSKWEARFLIAYVAVWVAWLSYFAWWVSR